MLDTSSIFLFIYKLHIPHNFFVGFVHNVLKACSQNNRKEEYCFVQFTTVPINVWNEKRKQGVKEEIYCILYDWPWIKGLSWYIEYTNQQIGMAFFFMCSMCNTCNVGYTCELYIVWNSSVIRISPVFICALQNDDYFSLAVHLLLTQQYFHIIKHNMKNVQHMHTYTVKNTHTHRGQGQESGKKMGRKEGRKDKIPNAF